MFRPLKTSGDEVKSAQKTLLYGHHGWGKTTQAAHMQELYGKTFIISGEAGLMSLSHLDIDYLAFNSWHVRGRNKPEEGIYSLQVIREMVGSDEFKNAGYKCIVLDSLTEAGDMLLAELEDKHKNSKNGFEKWADYKAEMLGTVKWFRDLGYHVLVTALAKEETNDNGGTEYWPLVPMATVQKQLPGIFDNVLAGVRRTEDTKDEQGRASGMRVERFIVCDQFGGWHGKVRDPRRRLSAIERTGNIADLFRKMDSDKSTETKTKKDTTS